MQFRRTTGIIKRGIRARSIGLCAAIAVIFFGATAGAQIAATLTDLGATAPTPGASDISQLSTSGEVKHA